MVIGHPREKKKEEKREREEKSNEGNGSAKSKGKKDESDCHQQGEEERFSDTQRLYERFLREHSMVDKKKAEKKAKGNQWTSPRSVKLPCLSDETQKTPRRLNIRGKRPYEGRS